MGREDEQNISKILNLVNNKHKEESVSDDVEAKSEEIDRSEQAFTKEDTEQILRESVGSYSATEIYRRDICIIKETESFGHWAKEKLKKWGMVGLRSLLYTNIAAGVLLWSDYQKIKNNKEAFQVEINEKYAEGMAARAPDDFAKLKHFLQTGYVPELESKKIFNSWYDSRIVAQVGLDMGRGNSAYVSTFANCARKDPEFLDDLCQFAYTAIAEGSKHSDLQPQITTFLLSLLDLPFVQQKFEEYAISAFVENPGTRAAFLEKLDKMGSPLVEKLLNDPLTQQIAVNFGEATIEDIIQALNGDYAPNENQLASVIKQQIPALTQRGITAFKNTLAKHKGDILYGNENFYAYSDGTQLHLFLTEAGSGADLNQILEQAHERHLSVSKGYIGLEPQEGHIKLSVGGDVEVEYDLLDELVNKIPFIAIAKEVPGVKTPVNMFTAGLGGFLTGEKNYTLDGIISQAKKNKEPVDWRGAAMRADFYAMEAKAMYVAHKGKLDKDAQKQFNALRQYAARLYSLAADHTKAAEELRGLFTDKNQVPTAEEYARAFRKMQEDILDDDLQDVIPAGATYAATEKHRKIHEQYCNKINGGE